jgi:hypothetical protein
VSSNLTLSAAPLAFMRAAAALSIWAHHPTHCWGCDLMTLDETKPGKARSVVVTIERSHSGRADAQTRGVGSNDASAPQFDGVLKRMLSSPPQPHVKKKPAGKPAQRKPR